MSDKVFVHFSKTLMQIKLQITIIHCKVLYMNYFKKTYRGYIKLNYPVNFTVAVSIDPVYSSGNSPPIA